MKHRIVTRDWVKTILAFLAFLALGASLLLIACNDNASSRAGQGDLAARLASSLVEQEKLQKEIERLRLEGGATGKAADTRLEAIEEELVKTESERRTLVAENASMKAETESLRKGYKTSVRAKAKGVELGDVTLRSGHSYQQVVVRSWEPDALRVRHHDGASRIPLEELPESVQQMFFYDPEETAALLTARTASDSSTATESPPDADDADDADDPGAPEFEPAPEPEVGPDDGISERPKFEFTKTELALEKVETEIEELEAEASALQREIRQSFRRGRGRPGGRGGGGGQARDTGAEKKAQRIADALTKLRAERDKLERSLDEEPVPARFND